MLNKQLMCAVVGLIISGATFADDVLVFKGTKMGSSEKELKVHFPNAKCRTGGRSSERFCNVSKGSIASVHIETAYVYFQDKLGEINADFDQAYYDAETNFELMVKVFQEKYGLPKRTQGKMVDYRGKASPNIIATWKFPYGTIQVKKFYGDYDVLRGKIIFRGPEYEAAMLRNHERDAKTTAEKAKKAAAKDL